MTHPLFTVLANEIGRGVAHAFRERFGRDIAVAVQLVPDPATGKPRPRYSFRLDKPGLLPNATERTFFDGAIAGYRAAVNIMMEVAEEFPELLADNTSQAGDDAYAETISSIEVSFAQPVNIGRVHQQRLVSLIGEICDGYEAKHPDRVMWPAGFGQKMLVNPLALEDDEPIPFDESCLSIECAERENYDYVAPETVQ